jgi:hypothetical protein
MAASVLYELAGAKFNTVLDLEWFENFSAPVCP